MRNRSKFVLAGLAATLLMAFAVSSASANRLNISNQQFRVTWRVLRLITEGGGIFNPTIECPVTLEGSFHSSTIVKAVGALVGYVTRAIVASGNCTSGSASVLTTTLPWHITYQGFTGTLPNITRVRLALKRTAFIAEFIGTECLYEENGGRGIAAGELNREASGNVNELSADTAIRLTTTSGGLCPPRGGFSGTGQVFLLGSTTTRIRLTLI